MDEMRKAFEAWAAEFGVAYEHEGFAWTAWQAATMAERERAERICRNEAEQNYDISRHAWGRLEGCADMIRDGDLP